MLKVYRPGKTRASSNYRIRGTYLGVRVDESSGTHKRSVAVAKRDEIEGKIERKEWLPSQSGEDVSFAAAALSYIQTGGSARYVAPLVKHFEGKTWKEIRQEDIDRAGVALRPSTSAATRNRCVYTPIAAILRHKEAPLRIRRPPGAKGKPRTDYLNPDDARAIIEAAETFDGDFWLLLTFLLYSGCRLGEALALQWEDIHGGTAYIRRSKNDDPRTVRVRASLLVQLEAARKPAGAVFTFTYGGQLKVHLKRATCLACGVAPPERNKPSPPHRLRWVNFHSFRHTFATWFRNAGGDVHGLIATGNWRDPKSVNRYTHVHAHAEWERVELFPSMGRIGAVGLK